MQCMHDCMHECMRSDACIAEREAEPEIACISACSDSDACIAGEKKILLL